MSNTADNNLIPARLCQFAAIDFETTGSVPGWPNEPWQIGIYEFTPCGNGSNSFSSYLRVSADRPFNRFAPGRHALVRDELAASPTLPELWETISPMILGRPLVAHNVGTERSMLRRAAPLHRPGPWIDTLKIARLAMPGLKSYALEDLVAALGLQHEIETLCQGAAFHDALFDAIGCAVLMRHFLSLPGWDNVAIADLENL